MAAPDPATVPKTAKARLRSLPWANVTVSMASAAGASSAAKAPWTPRAMTSSMPLCDSPAQSEAAPKPIIPTMKVRLRPQ
jgi:hypothetical protein